MISHDRMSLLFDGVTWWRIWILGGVKYSEGEWGKLLGIGEFRRGRRGVGWGMSWLRFVESESWRWASSERARVVGGWWMSVWQLDPWSVGWRKEKGYRSDHFILIPEFCLKHPSLCQDLRYLKSIYQIIYLYDIKDVTSVAPLTNSANQKRHAFHNTALQNAFIKNKHHTPWSSSSLWPQASSSPPMPSLAHHSPLHPTNKQPQPPSPWASNPPSSKPPNPTPSPPP